MLLSAAKQHSSFIVAPTVAIRLSPLSVSQVASRLAVVLACVYAVLVLIVLVNLLIAIVDETYGTVKESEADQMLRNKALIIDEIESTLTDAVIKDLNGR